MKLAVVDDEEQERKKLLGFLSRFQREFRLSFETETFSSAEALLSNYHAVYDIIFFDIEMDGMNGMEAARHLRETDKNVTLLFVTNMAQYAIQGYEVDAADYLLKPVRYEEFALKLKKALRRTAQRKDRYILLETPEESRRISVASIRYVEVMGHYLIFHTKDRDYKIRGSMKACEAELLPYNFTRIHRAYLVNLSSIDTLRGADVLLDGEALPVGGMYRDRLMQDYMAFARG